MVEHGYNKTTYDYCVFDKKFLMVILLFYLLNTWWLLVSTFYSKKKKKSDGCWSLHTCKIDKLMEE